MTRAVIKLKDGTYINVSANRLELRKSLIMVWNDEELVAIVKSKDVITCHISEQKNDVIAHTFTLKINKQKEIEK